MHGPCMYLVYKQKLYMKNAWILYESCMAKLYFFTGSSIYLNKQQYRYKWFEISNFLMLFYFLVETLKYLPNQNPFQITGNNIFFYLI